MKILAIDLGKFKSVACVYESATGEHSFTSVSTKPSDIYDLLTTHHPQRVVIEIGSAAGWIHDLAVAMEIPIQVANPNHEAWRWKNVKRKTDKDDALKLARLSAMNQLPTLALPSSEVRQWRSLIGYRNTLVARRTAIKNHIRSLLDRQGIRWPGGRSGWTDKSISALKLMASLTTKSQPKDLWRFELQMELESMAQLQTLINQVEDKLDDLAKDDVRVQQLQSIPGVGPRLAEVVVAVIDDATRFKNAKQVGAYAGLTPTQFESGTMSRQGGISGRGNKLLRALLVQVAWLARRCNGKISQIFEAVCRGNKTRRKIAVIATARRLLVICWAMLRDGTLWREPSPPPNALPTN
ncbi:IS110 family transposase [Planctomicrobium sp. SH527]|uniref:IS110 family transposase n=1 Tax=Planctomicrobium sp. SH527 TaxID=3448123 RepID=UPI003F5B9602